MLSNVDKLLLSPSNQAEVTRLKNAYLAAQAVGDTVGMDRAHARAEAIRAAAGYSGGEGGDRYQLLENAYAPAGYNGYQRLLEEPINTAMGAIAAGYQAESAALQQQRKEAEQEGQANQAAARSAVWNAQRLARDGFLTRGLGETGVADVITATALNQAAANAYQALLDRQNDLAELNRAEATAKADALQQAASVQQKLGGQLAEGYTDFYEMEHELQKMTSDYYYKRALQLLKQTQ